MRCAGPCSIADRLARTRGRRRALRDGWTRSPAARAKRTAARSAPTRRCARRGLGAFSRPCSPLAAALRGRKDATPRCSRQPVHNARTTSILRHSCSGYTPRDLWRSSPPDYLQPCDDHASHASRAGPRRRRRGSRVVMEYETYDSDGCEDGGERWGRRRS